MAEKNEVDEVLAALWILEEEGRPADAAALAGRPNLPAPEAALAQARAEQLAAGPEDRPVLTPAGRTRGAMLVRRQRLAERLLADALEVSQWAWEAEACAFEHVLGEEVTRAICTFLGHPARCPHGKPIPPGDCCRAGETRLEPLVAPLAVLQPGEEGRVAWLACSSHRLLDRLGGVGLLPGAEVRLHQRFPSFIVFVGETQLALDEETARAIFVRRGGTAAAERL